MADPDSLKASCSVVVDLSVDRFDLAGWIPNFSNEEYLACTPVSHAHKQMFVYRDADGGYVFRNDEMAAGFMMTQLYRPEIMEPRHVLLVSPRTKARYLIRLSYWTEAHTEEETPHFAESAVRWAKRNDSETRS